MTGIHILRPPSFPIAANIIILTQKKSPTQNHREFFWQERILKTEVHLFTIVVVRR